MAKPLPAPSKSRYHQWQDSGPTPPNIRPDQLGYFGRLNIIHNLKRKKESERENSTECLF